MNTPNSSRIALQNLLQDVRQCQLCADQLVHGVNPVIRASTTARILIVGQAPGKKVHDTSIPWNDASGKRLRQWLALEPEVFYDETQIAIVPMGFCYPGKGKNGDLPPRPECAATWHQPLLAHMPNIQLTLLIGQYAQRHYLQDHFKTLTERVQHWREHSAEVISLPHPSPRNQIWLKKNPWFEQDLVPHLQQQVHEILR